MQDLTIKSYNVNMTNKYKVNTVQTYNKVNFTGLLDVFFRDDTQPKFIPTCKISENETKYVGELCTYLAKSRLSPGELQSAYRRIYSTLKTPDEKKLFRDYFGKYLPPVPSKTEQQSIEQPKPSKPAAPAAPVPVKSPETNGSSKKIPENNTAKSLLKEFDSIEKENIPAFVSKAAKGSREEQYQLLDLYINKSKDHKQLPANSTERLALGTKLATLRKQMEEKNISFVPKAPEKFDTEEQKWKYINTALSVMEKNENSIFDAFDVFEKYGAKKYINRDSSFSTLDDLSTSTVCCLDKILEKGRIKGGRHDEKSIDLTNRVLQRFTEVFSKFATTKPEKSTPDVRLLWYVFDRYEYCMNKETMLVMIEQIDKLAVDKKECKKLNVLLNHYEPKLYECLSPENIRDVELAVKKLEKKTEKLPDDYSQI